MSELAFVGVRKRYGDVVALADLDLQARDGEFLVLVGPSGCGKTTALRLAAGLDRATAGMIHIGGRDVTDLPPGRRNVSMVFQSYALFPHLTVAENIGFGLRARRVPLPETRDRVDAAATAVGCRELLGRKPHELSGGERQRVALARALVREPDVFLLDEPLSNLDSQLRVKMRTELRRLHQRVGATMVYVTHDQVEALTLADRVAVLRAGVLQQVGTPDEVYESPANRFVGTFIGSPAMNILPVAAVDGRFVAGGFTLDLPRRDIRAARVEVGIRPEHLVVSSDGVPARVQVVEAAGAETFLHVETGGLALVVRADAGMRPPVGSTVHLAVVPGSGQLFDADTGASVR